MTKLFLIIATFYFSIVIECKADTTNILITYFSKTGNTEAMALKIKAGAESIKNTSVLLKKIEETTTSDLLNADAIIVGSPVYNANVAPAVQDFINNWPFKNAPLKNKIGAAFVTSGGISAGEELVQVNILHSMLIFGMIVVGGSNWESAFGASAVTSEDAYKNQKINEHFLQKAFDLGSRVAEISARLRKE
ncbi:MAG: NAD(P)H-dependent oxidoreductase [Calditrichae bacterium]|nr:NAD(P)H-dependent oxidoreductase [Calditrichota bacterium]MCB9059364.1 NAD(P)H-dependent oxidoreductase [Calditrichia bacterium]